MSRNFSNEPDANILSRLPFEESAALIVITLIAGVVLMLWLIPAPDRFLPDIWYEMPPNTASFMLLSAASLAFGRKQTAVIRRRLGMALAALVLLYGALTLTEYAASVSHGFGGLLPPKLHGHNPGRPVAIAALGFTMLGVCMLILRQARNIWSRIADIAALALFMLNFVMLGSVFFGAVDGGGYHRVISPQSLFSFFCFGTVVMLRRAEQGDMLAVLVNIGIGSRMVRVILPFATFVPLLLLLGEAWLVNSGLTSKPCAQALVAAAAATSAACFISWSGWRINALERELRDLSLTDELTHVFNRRGFYFLGQHALREAQRTGTGLGVFFFDLDGLKHVNDLLGHETGSEMIKDFTKILSSTFRKSDIIGRMGGDEFAVFTIRDEAIWIQSVYARLDALTREHNADRAKTYPLSFSTGYAELSRHGETLDTLVTRADVLMYQDKARRKLIA